MAGTAFEQIMVGKLGMFPVQMLWGVAFTVLGWFLFNRHDFGLHIRCIGDNKDSAREMGINVERTKVMAFILVGLCAAVAGVWSNLINQTFYPTTGDGYMLQVLAAVFVEEPRRGAGWEPSLARSSERAPSGSSRRGSSPAA